MKTFVTYAHQIGAASLVSVGLLTVSGTAAEAACLAGHCRQNGLVFSQASNNFRITNVLGKGIPEDPFVVYQDVWGLDISLAVSNLTNTPQHSIFSRPGFAISIVSRNLTGAFWRFYDHELQETAGYASSENDGLSFAQGIGPLRPYISSHYDRADEITDVRDFINFYQGIGVNPGETVRFNYVITDTIPNQSFFIRQRPDYRPNAIPTPTVSPQPLPSKPSAPIPALPNPTVPTAVSVLATAPEPAVLPQSKQQIEQPITPKPISEPSTTMMTFLVAAFSKAVKQHQQHTATNHDQTS